MGCVERTKAADGHVAKWPTDSFMFVMIRDSTDGTRKILDCYHQSMGFFGVFLGGCCYLKAFYMPLTGWSVDCEAGK